MPIIIPQDIPAFDILTKENVFVMGELRAQTQDIRPIEIAIVNLMPTKIETETQLIRLLSNSPLQVNLTLVKTSTYTSKHTQESHMNKFYKTFSQIKNSFFDGMIITGAPVETLEFDEVAYWKELCKIMDYAEQRVTSTIYICWGAQAALYHHYGIGKIHLDKKMFGIFPNRALLQYDPLLKGLDDYFYVPHSRHTAVDEQAVYAHPELCVMASGAECGISIAKSKDNSKLFFFGHSEYDRETIKGEYLRDVKKGLPIERPVNYFTDEGTDNINMSWRSTANLLFYNWLNYYVYQVTPFQFT
ncbi:MAG: homoserine O-succinyltransferase [Christensenellales bacterium]|jgi:homoserine O-succinyltransferase